MAFGFPVCHEMCVLHVIHPRSALFPNSRNTGRTPVIVCIRYIILVLSTIVYRIPDSIQHGTRLSKKASTVSLIVAYVPGITQQVPGTGLFSPESGVGEILAFFVCYDTTKRNLMLGASAYGGIPTRVDERRKGCSLLAIKMQGTKCCLEGEEPPV